MKASVYNQQGEKVEEMELPKEIFGRELNPDLVHQVIVSQRANRRQISAHTKTRADVRGGGKKPWRQKGTGRARHGSIRSPIWRGGGVTFGPRKEKIFKKKIPKKMKRKALLMVLSKKFKDNLLIFLDKLKLEKAKTKLIIEIIKAQSQNLKDKTKKRKSFLLVLPKIDKKVILATNNIPKTATIQAKDLNCLDLLNFQYLIMPKDSIKVIEETFIKSGKDKAQSEKPKTRAQNAKQQQT